MDARCARCAANLQADRGGVVLANVIQIAFEPIEIMLFYPVEDECIGCHKPKTAIVMDTVQRPYPGVELLVWYLVL